MKERTGKTSYSSPKKPQKVLQEPKDSMNSYVSEFIGKIKITEPIITFPSSIPPQDLKSQDYQLFLEKLIEKYKAAGRTIDRLILPAHDLAAIMDNLHLLQGKSIVSSLNLLLSQENDLKLLGSYFEKIKYLDFKVSIEGEFSKSSLEALVDLIEKNPQICINLLLPEPWNHSPLQMRLDELHSSRVRPIRIAAFAAESQANYAEMANIAPQKTTVKRTRSNAPSEPTVSIEMQQEAEQQQQQQHQAESSGEGAEGELSGKQLGRLYTYNDFFSILFDNSNPLSKYVKGSVDRNFWSTLFGLADEDEKTRPLQISENALIELMEHSQKFNFGLDLKRLPAGFSFIKEKNQMILHFSQRAKELSARDPLAINCHFPEKSEPLCHDFIQLWLNSVPDGTKYRTQSADETLKIIWNTIVKSEHYDKNKHDFFKSHLHELRVMSPKSIEQIFANGPDLKLFEETLRTTLPTEAVPLIYILLKDNPVMTMKIRQLSAELALKPDKFLPIYNVYGQEGIDKFVSLKNSNPELFTSLNKVLFTKKPNLAPVLSKEYEQAMQVLRSLNKEQYACWQTLFEKHCRSQGDCHLPDLVNAFATFCNKIEDLNKAYGHINGKISFSAFKDFKDIKSLPVALSRMLTILENCRPENIYQQSLCLSKLDLSSTGATKALRAAHKGFDENWQFFTEEMELTKIEQDYRTNNKGYSDAAKSTCLELTQVDPKDFRKEFFRFIAKRPDQEALSQDFYLQVLQKINSAGLSDRVKQLTLALTAGSSTGGLSLSFIKDEKDALEKVDQLIGMLLDPPIPAITKFLLDANQLEFVRQNTLNLFLRLAPVPPLPVLHSLLTMVNQLVNSIAVLTLFKELEAAPQKINDCLQSMGGAVYKGLKNYDEKFIANNPKLFFEYFNTVDYLRQKKADPYVRTLLAGLISTFRLDAKAIDEILQRCPDMEKYPKYTLLLELFNHVSLDGKKPLNFQKFISMGMVLRVSDQANSAEIARSIVALVKDDPDLVGYFDEDLLDNFGKPNLSDEIVSQIKDSPILNVEQKKTLRNILRKFYAPGDNQHYQKIVEKILKIATFIGPEKISLFLNTLNKDFLYSPSYPLSSENNFFMKNLDFMLERKSIDNFIYFLSNMESGMKVKKREAQEALFCVYKYQTDVLNNIHNIPEKSYGTAAILPVACELLVNTPFVQLANPLNTKREDLQKLEKGAAMLLENAQPKTIDQEELKQDLQKALLNPGSDTVQAIAQKYTLPFASIAKTLEAILDEPLLNNAKETTHTNESLQDLHTETSRLAKRQNDPQVQQAWLNFLLLQNNPTSDMPALIAWFNKDKNQDEEKKSRLDAQFKMLETSHSDLLTSLMENKDYLDTLIANPAFMNQFLSKDVQNIVQGSFIGNDEQLVQVLEALNSDLKQCKVYSQTLKDGAKNLKSMHQYQSSWFSVHAEILSKVHRLGQNYPAAKDDILELINHLPARYNPESDSDLLLYVQNLVDELESDFSWINDPNIIVALCYHFKNTDNLVEILKGTKIFDDVEEMKVFSRELDGMLQNIAREHQVSKAEVVSFLDTQVKKMSFSSLDVLKNTLKSFKKEDAQVIHSHSLLALLQEVKQFESTELRNILLKIATVTLNGNTNYTQKDFSTLCYFISGLEKSRTGQYEVAVEFLRGMYAKPPYPSMLELNGWLIDAQKEYNLNKSATDENQSKLQSYTGYLKEAKQNFIKNPYPRDTTNNGFHVDKARKIIQSNEFMNHGLNEGILTRLRSAIEIAKNQSVEGLCELFNEYKNNPGKAFDEVFLLAIVAELLFYSKGWEMNTHQYLAELAILTKGQRVTAGIGTGEGKSRISLVLLACQHAMGKTVDFITADVALATRDFINAQSFFDILGIKSTIIYAHSDPASYQLGGINFSDPANLNLFRNAAYAAGKSALVIDPTVKRRAAVLDESDKLLYDFANTRFNYSSLADKSIQDMPWIYDLLVDFFDETDPAFEQRMQAYYNDVDSCNHLFKTFVKMKCAANPERINQVAAISDKQIEQWHDSAVNAGKLELDRHFTIKTELINTKSGPVYASVAKLLDKNNRVSKHSQFSFGVQQCLHARLNKLFNQKSTIKNSELAAALGKNIHPFHIADEKQIAYSTTSKNCLDCYENGMLYCITGTPGAQAELKESTKLYNLELIIVPRAKGMRRKITEYWGMDNEKTQLGKLKNVLKTAKSQNQPVLIICENDMKSQEFEQLLRDEWGTKYNFQRLHAGLPLEEENAMLEKAGQSKTISISTAMVGRGVDIALKGNLAKDHGLCVIMLYIPELRDQQQIEARAGRFGQEGTAFVIPNLEEYSPLKTLKTMQGKTLMVRDLRFYIQESKDRKNQRERLIKNVIGDFRNQLQSHFYELLEQVPDPEQRNLLKENWAQFFGESDKSWNTLWPKMEALIPQVNNIQSNLVALKAINGLLEEHHTDLKRFWGEFLSKAKNAKLDPELMEKMALDLPDLQLAPSLFEAFESKTGILYSCLQDKLSHGFFAGTNQDNAMSLMRKQLESLLVKPQEDIDREAKKFIIEYLKKIFAGGASSIISSKDVTNHNTLAAIEAAGWNTDNSLFSLNTKDFSYSLNPSVLNTNKENVLPREASRSKGDALKPVKTAQSQASMKSELNSLRNTQDDGHTKKTRGPQG